jgi:hypothetical protein
MSKDIFSEINDFAKDVADGFFIEHAVQVHPSERVVTAGVQLEAREFHAPLFLSVDELRRLADEAERRTKEMIS